MIKNNFTGERYATRGILSCLDFEVINYIWKALDDFIKLKEVEPDYLQIFNLKTKKIDEKYHLVAEHIQEVPEYCNMKAFEVTVNRPINEKIFVISDYDEDKNEYLTMLLGSEY